MTGGWWDVYPPFYPDTASPPPEWPGPLVCNCSMAGPACKNCNVYRAHFGLPRLTTITVTDTTTTNPRGHWQWVPDEEPQP
jgi:hypothetical protein